MKLKRFHLMWMSLVAVSLVAAGAALAAPTKTIADLKAAYLGESTAHAKYAVYAKKAAQEGHADVARLFRAASTAEGIHARNHKAVLVTLGVKNPKAGAFTQAPVSTAAALKDAIKGETYEKTTMYPNFIRDAQAEKQAAAVTSMSQALAAEGQHAALYTSALKSLKTSGGGAKVAQAAYFVCPICGATYRGAAPAFCPTCGAKRESFLRVS